MKNHIFSINLSKLKSTVIAYVNDNCKDFGITGTQSQYLSVLMHDGKNSQNDISRKLGYDKAYSSRILSELEEDGFVVPGEDENDCRKKLYQITKKGEEVASVVEQKIDIMMKQVLFKDIDSKQKAEFEKIVDKMILNMSEYFEKGEKRW